MASGVWVPVVVSVVVSEWGWVRLGLGFGKVVYCWIASVTKHYFLLCTVDVHCSSSTVIFHSVSVLFFSLKVGECS